MLVTINVPDDVSPAIIKHYVDELEEKLKQHKTPEHTLSKWAKMLQRIESKSFDLGDYTQTFDQYRQEFRQSFYFCRFLGLLSNIKNTEQGDKRMQMSFDLTDEVVQQLQKIPNLDSFVNKVIHNALQNKRVANDNLSKWSLIAQEIKNNPALNLDGYSVQLKQDTLEVREHFTFQGDESLQ